MVLVGMRTGVRKVRARPRSQRTTIPPESDRAPLRRERGGREGPGRTSVKYGLQVWCHGVAQCHTLPGAWTRGGLCEDALSSLCAGFMADILTSCVSARTTGCLPLPSRLLSPLQRRSQRPATPLECAHSQTRVSMRLWMASKRLQWEELAMRSHRRVWSGWKQS